jgi:uncharacterized protein with von Willebrand factor type A (vWA) domain
MPDGSPYEGGKLLHNLLLFGRLCKALGMEVNPNRMMDAARALQYIELGRRQDVYHTLRALIVTRQRDLELFDEAFNRFWQRPNEEWTTLDLRSLSERRQKKTQFLPPPEATPENGDTGNHSQTEVDTSPLVIMPTYSQVETLRYKDFAEMTGEEIALARRLLEQLPWSLGVRKTRRHRSGNSEVIDPRRAFRQNLRFAGEPLALPTRTLKMKPRPLVLLCDISGSMERYTRLLLHFMHTLSQSIYQVEAFVFSTRLTRITRHIQRKSVDAALAEVGVSVKDWGGGTRTGDALHTFNYHWSRRVLGRGAVVLLITDGWDRGDPDTLRREMARLQRNCYRLIWLNPLLGAPQYEPLTRGAQAMLPYVDDFFPVRNLSNLEMLVRELWRVNWRRPERTSNAHLNLER